jgi:poly(A) polymerase
MVYIFPFLSFFSCRNLCRAGTVESRLRQLVMKLELVESLTLAHPFVKGFEQVAYCVSDEEVRLVAQGETTEVIAKRKSEDIEGIEGARPVYSTTFYVGLGIEAKQRAWIIKD